MTIPRKHLNVLAGARETVALSAVKQWAPSDGFLLVLAGLPGTGKSVAAAWAVEGGPPRKYPGNDERGRPEWKGWRFERLPEFISSGELSTMAQWTEEYKRLLQVCLLAVDDVGIEHSFSGQSVQKLNELVSRRFDDELKTILTTNMPRSRFEREYGARMMDRIDDRKGWVGLDGQRSMRGE